MARFIQLPSKKTLNLDAILWIDHPPQQRALRVVFYGQGELLIKEDADKEMLLRVLRRVAPEGAPAKPTSASAQDYIGDF